MPLIIGPSSGTAPYFRALSSADFTTNMRGFSFQKGHRDDHRGQNGPSRKQCHGGGIIAGLILDDANDRRPEKRTGNIEGVGERDSGCCRLTSRKR